MARTYVITGTASGIAAATARLLKEAGNKNYTVHRFPGLNHLFQACQTGTVAEYGRNTVSGRTADGKDGR